MVLIFTSWYVRFDFSDHDNPWAIRFLFLYHAFKTSTYVLLIIFSQHVEEFSYWKENNLIYFDLIIVSAATFVLNDFLLPIQLGCIFATAQWCIAFYSLLNLYSVRYNVPFFSLPKVKC